MIRMGRVSLRSDLAFRIHAGVVSPSHVAIADAFDHNTVPAPWLRAKVSVFEPCCGGVVHAQSAVNEIVSMEVDDG